MKEAKEQVYDCGVIVGRFQVDSLSEGHMQIIEHVYESHPKTIIFLGLSPCKCTVNNPLDFESRKQMILECFPNASVLYIKDMHSDKRWSETLDEQISDICGPNQKVTIYGSRDSFIKHYTGSYYCTELEQEVYSSGTEIRRSISAKVKSSADFRKGVIWATSNQYPKAFPTIDVAIVNEDITKILLGKRRQEDKYRFIGGFVSPGETLEETVLREAKEESNVDLHSPQYICSVSVNDWRYKNEVDKILTSLFIAVKKEGTPRPGDDIHELKWFDINDKLAYEVVDTHVILAQKFIEFLPPPLTLR